MVKQIPYKTFHLVAAHGHPLIYMLKAVSDFRDSDFGKNLASKSSKHTNSERKTQDLRKLGISRQVVILQ